ncbi:MarR family winged helix-turn-helix transcriptional regulator [Frigoribacterium faeni]|uniref:DNA-binding MarR family transcriptional regulator n=1 Tax=Frigoribacterium faeni TaxID=145483 RepID=A0A7W3PHQ0_9MICO|nr:MarR family transcriptional regulator [Frigoribacterium faeni]MBA8811874.1 DNA-binding MarR family transcriptional regulator [Frigoribacterium faeni]BFF12857.1 hypothetical protein GCM10025699_41600 [Microbacterium flavescens]GEK84590.1 hypothetical protein FFA01_28990 [Frigoribacterium faeni]
MPRDIPQIPENAPESVIRLGSTLQRLNDANRRYRVHTAKVLGMGTTELSALLAIADADDVTPSALSRDLVLSSGATTAVIDRLEKGGYIVRTSHPGDRRSLHLSLSEKGAGTVDSLNTAYQFVLSTTGTDEAIASALPQLDRISDALDAAALEI